MRLRDLDARFVRNSTAPDFEVWDRGPTLAEAHGVMFLCPKCAEGKPVEAGNPEFGEDPDERIIRGAHSIVCWFVGRPPNVKPNGRWNPSGTGLDDLTFVPPGAVSVQIVGGCGAHFFIRNGDAS